MAEDMVLRPKLMESRKPFMATLMAEQRAVMNSGVFNRLGRRIAKFRKRRQARRIAAKKPSSAMVKLLRSPALFVLEYGADYVATQAMLFTKAMTGMTFENQGAALSRFLFGDAPAQVRAANRLREAVMQTPQFRSLVMMQQFETLYQVTRPLYDRILQEERAWMMVKEKLPGQLTEVEMVTEHVVERMRTWWNTYKNTDIPMGVAAGMWENRNGDRSRFPRATFPMMR